MALDIKLDEDLPAAAAELLRKAGHRVETVIDQGLGGAKDPHLWSIVQSNPLKGLPLSERRGSAGVEITASPPVTILTLTLGPSTVASMDYRGVITIEPGKRGGKPCVRGLRITVYEVLDYLAAGMSEQDILRDFPDLTAADIRACLAFAADRERKLASAPPSV